MEFIMLAMGFPSVYHQGPGLIDRIGDLVHFLGTRPLIVIGPVEKDLIGLRLESALKTHSVNPVFFNFEGEVSLANIQKVVDQATSEECDFAIGVGGGKAIDVSKAVKLKLGLPVVVVPTIASNDAPTSRMIITYNADGTFRGPLTMSENPDAVIVDSSVIAAAPVRYLLAGIGDGLATWFEACQCHDSGVDNFLHGQPGETMLAMSELCYTMIRKYGVQAIADHQKGEVTDHLEKIIEANILLSGLGFEGCGVAAAHAFSQGFSLIPELHDALHGELVAVGLIGQLALEERSDDFIIDLLAFYRSIGLPSSLRMLGLQQVCDHHLKIVSEFACRPGSRMHNMSFPITADMAVSALQRAEKLSLATV
jgi:glycerol dehydrogenase